MHRLIGTYADSQMDGRYRINVGLVDRSIKLSADRDYLSVYLSIPQHIHASVPRECCKLVVKSESAAPCAAATRNVYVQKALQLRKICA